jgi:hypothetical protein
MILKLGTEAREVAELRLLMQRVGYHVGHVLYPEIFDGVLCCCVLAYQEDRGLTVDGEVVYMGGETWPCLAAEPEVRTVYDPSSRAARLSRGLDTLYDWTTRRMIPEYRSSSIDAWERMEAGDDHQFVVPLASDSSGRPGATCGHAAWLLTSWWMRAMHPDKGIFPTWRTGRGPTNGMPLRFLPLAPVEGVTYEGKLHRGLAEYVACKGTVKELADLDGAFAGNPHWYICQKRSGHIVCVLRIDGAFGCIDPRTGLPAVPGPYRLAADGSKSSIGRPWTWRRVRPGETGPWTCYGMADLPPSGEIEWGPLAGAPDLPLVME